MILEKNMGINNTHVIWLTKSSQSNKGWLMFSLDGNLPMKRTRQPYG